jgi:neopullulanase
MIFNHCGDQHIWFLDRPSHDWFNFPDGYRQTSYRLTPHFDPYVSEYDKSMTVEGWFVESMPDLNQHNPHLMKYLTQNSIWWIEFSGIDGIRMAFMGFSVGETIICKTWFVGNFIIIEKGRR